MMSEQAGIRDHIHKTIETMESLATSKDFAIRKQFCRVIGDQYEALIALSASELRGMAGDAGSDWSDDQG